MRRRTASLGAISRRSLLTASGAGALAAAAPAVGKSDQTFGAGPDLLVRVFRDPPPEARPGIHWYWMNGIVTREGIVADLNAMARIGIGRTILFSIGFDALPEGMTQYRSLTPEWWGMMTFAIEHAGKVGVEITVGVVMTGRRRSDPGSRPKCRCSG